MEICIDKRQAVLQIKLGHRKAVDFMGNRAFILYDIHVIIKFSLFFEHGGEGAVA